MPVLPHSVSYTVQKTLLYTYFSGGVRQGVIDQNIRDSIKREAKEIEYPAVQGIPIKRINTQSLCRGGANTLALAGYSDTHIQNMGRWRGATFKESICKDLACNSKGMYRYTKRNFNIVNIAGGAYHDSPITVMIMDYTSQAPAA